jgi:hypothetical protein
MRVPVKFVGVHHKRVECYLVQKCVLLLQVNSCSGFKIEWQLAIAQQQQIQQK